MVHPVVKFPESIEWIDAQLIRAFEELKAKNKDKGKFEKPFAVVYDGQALAYSTQRLPSRVEASPLEVDIKEIGTCYIIITW